MITHRTVRHLIASLAFATAMLSGVQASDVPGFVRESMGASARATVATVRPAADIDVVLLDGGLDQGFRAGMSCQVMRGEMHLADVVLVEVRQHVSAALIFDLKPDTAIRSGDIARIKTLISAQ